MELRARVVPSSRRADRGALAARDRALSGPLLLAVLTAVIALAGLARAGTAAAAGPAGRADACTATATQLCLRAGSVSLAQMATFAGQVSAAGEAVVVITGKSDLAPAPGDARHRPGWQDVVSELAAARFVVVVPRAGPTGTAGALLYALARDRVIASGVVVPRLPGTVADYCRSAFCGRLKAQPGSALTVTSASPQQDIADTDVLSPPAVSPSPAPKPGGGPGATTWLLIALLVAVVAGTGWLTVGRRRVLARPAAAHGGDPGHGGGTAWVRDATVASGAGAAMGIVPAAVAGRSRRGAVPAQGGWREPATRVDAPTPAGPAHGPGEAVVATVLGPEGYVEIDGILYRGTWRGSRAVPRPGAVVAVARDRHGDLALTDWRAPGGGE
ncbi:MAG TPA: hypothetical protein VH478_07720 [Trebonia sp.]|nr:hypothetical protein [Trebonia sp.]